MSAREFKPGDVAMVTAMNRLTPYKAMFVDGVWAEVGDIRPTVALKMPSSIRPLVVIDPEDREQVERLAECYRQVHGEAELTDEPWSVPGLRMQAALREFADPKPRIEEPTGLGAVVEDADGRRWIRTNPSGANQWINEDAGVLAQLGYFAFRDIDAVRVLSEGVTS